MSNIVGEARGEGAADTASNIWTSYSTRDRTLLTIGCVASYFIFSSVSRLFSYPSHPGHEASLMVQPSPVILLIMTVVVLLACVLITSFFAGIVHYEAGLFCAAVGMVALSVRGGPMRYVLMESPGRGVFVKLIIELVMLFVFVMLGWFLLGLLRDKKLLSGEPGEEDAVVIPGQGAIALGAQIVLMIVLMLILSQTDRKAQAIWSVAISACLAAWGAHSLFPARPSVWFWTTPLIVGVFGYALAAAGGNELAGGAVGGLLPALARPVPLDYASVGVAGSIYGYWISQWPVEHEPESPQEVEQALEHPPAAVAETRGS